ncbi:MAG: hypothetical protein ABSF53_19855 [Terracidiphilus sp.]
MAAHENNLSGITKNLEPTACAPVVKLKDLRKIRFIPVDTGCGLTFFVEEAQPTPGKREHNTTRVVRAIVHSVTEEYEIACIRRDALR